MDVDGATVTVETEAGTHTLTDHAGDPGLELDVTIHRLTDRELVTAIVVPSVPMPTPPARPARPLRRSSRPAGAAQPGPVPTRRSGSPTKGSQSSSPTAAAPRGGGRPSSEPFAGDLAGTGARRPGWLRWMPLSDVDRPARPRPCRHPRVVLRRLPGGPGRVCGDPTGLHAAIAGAPVTDWRLYDTHYTERYLGHPDDELRMRTNAPISRRWRPTSVDRPLAAHPWPGRRQRGGGPTPCDSPAHCSRRGGPTPCCRCRASPT